jgi:uncharacterized membrane protein YcaP (DUF421 family)
MDFTELFSFTVSPLELIARGTCIYWFIFALFRFVLRRDVGSIAIADVLLLVLIADASANGMSGQYETVAEGMLLVATLAFWNYLLDWASYHSPALRRLLEPSTVKLVENGEPLRKNLRRELITMDELMSEVRKQGLESLADVQRARMESDGKISILPVEGKRAGRRLPQGGGSPEA